MPPERVPGALGRPEQSPARRICPACGGSGQIRIPGDPLAQTRLLEIAGLVGRRAPAPVVTYDLKRALERPKQITSSGQD